MKYLDPAQDCIPRASLYTLRTTFFSAKKLYRQPRINCKRHVIYVPGRQAPKTGLAKKYHMVFRGRVWLTYVVNKLAQEGSE